MGDLWARRLIAHYGTATAAVNAPDKELLDLTGFGAVKLKALRNPAVMELAQRELEIIQRDNIKYVTFGSDDYPSLLRRCPDAPIILFMRGNIQLEGRPTISIVGTRQLTATGEKFLHQFMEQIRPLDPVIISGYAYGTDIKAHRLALEHNLQTVACLAHGLNQTYPRVHERYNKDMEAHGGFITDFFNDDDFQRQNFLGRNRVIAGLSECTLVVESASKGGSLVTADFANQYDRAVFAVPGRFDDTYSEGCNNFIKQHKAIPITGAADMVYHLNWKLEAPVVQQKSLFVELDQDERPVYAFLKKEGTSELDDMNRETDIPVHRLASLLFQLEMKGLVRALPGKRFELV